MKQRLFAGLILCVLAMPSGAFGQATLSVGAKRFVREYRAQGQERPLPQTLIDRHDLLPWTSDDHAVGVAALVGPSFDAEVLRRKGIAMHSAIGDIRTFRVPLAVFEEFLVTPGLRYIDISEVASPELQLSLPSTRADSVHLGLGGLLKAYRGQGVVIAVIDWGFDFTHPNFYDSTLTDMRLSRAWDQNKLSGPAPAGYSFGAEYVGRDALLAAQSDTLYTFGPISHGTHVAGIAAGSSAGTPYLGAAPEAELVFIALRRDAPSLIDAYTYIRDYAASVGKPFVVNMSFGLHTGPHDGNLLPSLAADMMDGPGQVFVASAGNNGSAAFHIDQDFGAAPGDTLRTVVGFGSAADYFGQTLSLWGSPHSSFSAGIWLSTNGNQVLFETPFFFTQDEPSLDTVFLVNGDTLRLILESLAIDPLSGRPHIHMEIRNRTNLKVILAISSEDSHVHVWNTIRLNIRYTNWGVAFGNNFPGARNGDIAFGIGEPGGCGRSSITVGSYQAEQFFPNGAPWLGNLSGFSSRGPTTDYRTKPEITSTGQSVISSINSFDINETSGFSTTVDFEGRTYAFKAYSGTSMSGPMVAGIVALMLEANPGLTGAEIKAILQATARLDSFTGNIGPEGNNTWGWGKANALAAVLAAEALTRMEQPRHMAESPFTLYPNPAVGQCHLLAGAGWEPATLQATLYRLDGQAARAWTFGPGESQPTLSLEGLPAGLYLLRLESGEALYLHTLVVGGH